MADSSFDIVSKLDHQEVDNAVNQAVKEVHQRYDFRNTGATLNLGADEIVMTANAEERVLAVLDVLQSKLIRRGISLKSLEVGEPKQSGKEVRLVAALKEGISTEDAKKIAKLIREEGPKGVKPLIQGDELRVSSKKRDDLQAVSALLKGKDLDVALQFINYRRVPPAGGVGAARPAGAAHPHTTKASHPPRVRGLPREEPGTQPWFEVTSCSSACCVSSLPLASRPFTSSATGPLRKLFHSSRYAS